MALFLLLFFLKLPLFLTSVSESAGERGKLFPHPIVRVVAVTHMGAAARETLDALDAFSFFFFC